MDDGRLAEYAQVFARCGTVNVPLGPFLDTTKVEELIRLVDGGGMNLRPWQDASEVGEAKRFVVDLALPTDLGALNLPSTPEARQGDLEKFSKIVLGSGIIEAVKKITECEGACYLLQVSNMLKGSRLFPHTHYQPVVVTAVLRPANEGGIHFVGNPDKPDTCIYHSRIGHSIGGLIINEGPKLHGVTEVFSRVPRTTFQLAFGERHTDF
jgi:hypothetical protein